MAPDRGHLVQDGEAVVGQIVRIAPRHALDPQPVLHQEGGVEADEQHPEVDLADPLIQHVPGELRPPEVVAGEHREHHGAEHHVVEVRNHEVGVGDVEVQRRAGQDDAGQAAEQEGGQEADRPEHGRGHGDVAAPHGADPVEELHPGRDGDQEGHEGEERQVHRTGSEHVMRPHRHRQSRDQQRRRHQADVAEHRLLAEHRQDFGDDAEERQRDDVDLGVPEEPEQVLPQHRAAGGRVEDVRPQHPVGLQHQQRRRQHREHDQHQDRGRQDVPGEDRQPEHRHPRCPQTDDRGDKVDRAEDGADTGQVQAHDPQVTAGPG